MISLLSIYFSFIFILALGEFSEKNSRLRVVGAPYVRPAVVICARMVSLHEPMSELTGWAHRGDTLSENLVRRHKTTVAGLYVGDNTSRRPVRGLRRGKYAGFQGVVPRASMCPVGDLAIRINAAMQPSRDVIPQKSCEVAKTTVATRSLEFMGRRRSVGENARVSAVSVPNGELGIQKIRKGDRRDGTIPAIRGNVANASHAISKTRGIVAAWRCLLLFAFFFLPPEMHFVLWGTLSKGQGASGKSSQRSARHPVPRLFCPPAFCPLAYNLRRGQMAKERHRTWVIAIAWQAQASFVHEAYSPTAR